MPAPTLSLSAPSTAYVDEPILIDARNSTGISRSPQSDGTPSVTIDFGDGFSANLQASGHSYRDTGTYTITLTGKASDGSSAQTTASITVSNIPAATGGNVQHLTDSGNATTNATNLQNAWNTAKAANTVEQEIHLDGNWPTLITGPITIDGPMAGNKYVTIKWTGLSVAHKKRVTPSDMNNAPTITAPTSTDATLPAIGGSNTAPSAANVMHHIRLIGLHVKKNSDTTTTDLATTQRLINIGTDSGGGQTTLAKAPYNFIIDRVWFDGGTAANSYCKNGLRIYAKSGSVVDCYFSPFQGVSGGTDTAAIGLNYGYGPYSFVNNELVASTENFNVSGGGLETNTATVSSPTTTSCTLSSVTNLELDQNIAFVVGGSYGPLQSTIVRSIAGNNITFDAIPTAPDNASTAEWHTTPSYWEFRQNYVHKLLSWRASDPSYAGVNINVKNLFEIKFSRYVVIDGNYFRYHWLEDQDYAIVFTPRNANGGASVATVIREVQFTNNIVRDVGQIFVFYPADGPGGDGYTQWATDFTVRNNLFRNIGRVWDSTAPMSLNLVAGDANLTKMKRWFYIHNTTDIGSGTAYAITDFGSNGGAVNSMWLDSINQDGDRGFRSNTSTTDFAANMATYFAPGDTTNWNKNLILNKGSNTYPTGAINQTATWSTIFVDYTNGDFTLVGGNPGKSAALDGTDVGVNMTTLNAATLHSVDGDWSGVGSSAPSGSRVKLIAIAI